VLATLVRRERVDLLSVQELTPQAAVTLAAVLPYAVALPEPGVTGTGLYSRFPLVRIPALEPRSDFRMPAAGVEVPAAGPVEVLAAHPVPPGTAAGVRQWLPELASLPPATPTGPVRILAGDFNATLDHAPLRDLLGSGYRDAADAAGAGFTWTWPAVADTRASVLGIDLPPVVIDHVLVDRRVAVRRVAVYDLPGSDHRPVFAELTLPAA